MVDCYEQRIGEFLETYLMATEHYEQRIVNAFVDSVVKHPEQFGMWAEAVFLMAFE